MCAKRWNLRWGLRGGDECGLNGGALNMGALDERHRATGDGERKGCGEERDEERRADSNDETKMDGSHGVGSFNGVCHAFHPKAWQ